MLLVALLLVQLVAGILAGLALEWLDRTHEGTRPLAVRWWAWLAAVISCFGYAYLVGRLIQARQVDDLLLMLAAALLLIAMGSTFVLCRQRSRTRR